jgi:hypothetical protein
MGIGTNCGPKQHNIYEMRPLRARPFRSIWLFFCQAQKKDSNNYELYFGPKFRNAETEPQNRTMDLLREKKCLLNKDRRLSDGKGRSVSFYTKEYLWDIVVDQSANKRAHKLDVICESEMSPQYGVGNFDKNDGYENGYIYDYVKLFYGNANIKLFTCCTPAKHHEPLGEKLNVWAKFHTNNWQHKKLIVVILPTVKKDAIRIGIGVKRRRTGRLEFEELKLPRQNG